MADSCREELSSGASQGELKRAGRKGKSKAVRKFSERDEEQQPWDLLLTKLAALSALMVTVPYICEVINRRSWKLDPLTEPSSRREIELKIKEMISTGRVSSEAGGSGGRVTVGEGSLYFS